MTIHLDTSFLIGALVKGSPEDGALRAWLNGGEPLAISAVAWAEFLCGPVTDAQVHLALTILSAPVAFGPEDSAEAARLFDASGRRRGSFVYCMIAATALRSAASLATLNVADYVRFEKAQGLRLVRIRG